MANGIIDNGTRADEFRTRIPDKMVLNEANKIFITDGTTDSVNNKSIPHVIGKNIIEAVNGAGAVANATHAVNADNATNVVLTTTANADGSTTIKAGTGSATIENCINAKVADFANRGKLSIDNDSTNGDKIWIGTPPATNAVNINNARNARYALYASLDEAKGTIETRLEDINTRLTNLGFREGSVTGAYIGNSIPAGTTLQIQGKYAILTLPDARGSAASTNQGSITLTVGYSHVKAAKDVTFSIGCDVSGYIKGTLKKGTNGINFTFIGSIGSNALYAYKTQIGFEIQ